MIQKLDHKNTTTHHHPLSPIHEPTALHVATLNLTNILHCNLPINTSTVPNISSMRDDEEMQKTNTRGGQPTPPEQGEGKLELGNISIEYGYMCQCGEKDGPSQNKDWFSAVTDFAGKSLDPYFTNDAFFSVCDGHGRDGDKCAKYAANRIPRRLKYNLREKAKAEGKQSADDLDEDDIYKTCNKAYVDCNKAMRDQTFDIQTSGTTCTSAYIQGDKKRILIANVGDSRAVLGRKGSARPLSYDQTPYRGSERKRIRDKGARVLSLDQIDHIAPTIVGTDELIPGTKEHHDYADLIEGEEEESGWRIWHQTKPSPGTAFTRSLGDIIAEDLGVIANPENVMLNLEEGDDVVVLATDGVFEFLTNQSVIDICTQFKEEGPLKASKEVISRSKEYWKNYESIIDDMTCIVIFIDSI